MIKRRTFISTALGATAGAALPRLSFGQGLAPFPLFDTHAHFYTNQPDKYPFNASGARYGAERMIAKAMANPMTPEAVFALWDKVGIELGTGVQYNSTYATDNSYLLDVSAQHPDRIIPIVILSPTDPATPATLEKMAKENRIAGVRFTGSPNAQGEVAFLSAAADQAWAAANQLGLAIVLMPLGTNIPAALTRVAQHADRFPNVRIVLDHIAFPRPQQLRETFGLTPQHVALADHDNIYYKYTSFLMSEMNAPAEVELEPFMQHMVSVFGADHFVWGTDFGNVEVDDVLYVQHALDSVQGLTLEQQKDIFYNVAKAVFVPGGRGPA